MRKTEKMEKGLNIEPQKPNGFHVEIDRVIGGMAVCVNGVISILDFTEDFAVLKVRGGRIKIIGKDMSISVFCNSAVEVVGVVVRVELL